MHGYCTLYFVFVCLSFSTTLKSEALYHEKYMVSLPPFLFSSPLLYLSLCSSSLLCVILLSFVCLSLFSLFRVLLFLFFLFAPLPLLFSCSTLHSMPFALNNTEALVYYTKFFVAHCIIGKRVPASPIVCTAFNLCCMKCSSKT